MPVVIVSDQLVWSSDIASITVCGAGLYLPMAPRLRTVVVGFFIHVPLTYYYGGK